MVVGLFFTMVEQTVGLFLTLPRGPGWRRIDSPSRVGAWSAWLTRWNLSWCFRICRAVSFESNNRLTVSPTSIRARLFNAPSINLALTRHQGDLSGCPWTSIKMTSRWDARCLGVVLVSVRYTRLDVRETSACTTCKRNWCGVIKNTRATSVWIMITPGRFTSNNRASGYIDVVLKYILWSYRGQTNGRPKTKIGGVGLNAQIEFGSIYMVNVGMYAGM